MDNQLAKKEILRVLDLFKYQVENDECTHEELRSLATLLAKELNAWVSAHDLAKIFDKKESNVRMVISRSHMSSQDKPKRKVLYRFGWFAKHRPSSWDV